MKNEKKNRKLRRQVVKTVRKVRVPGPKLKLRHGPPFDRDFFAETLGRMAEACPCPEGHHVVVRVHLVDGSLDVCNIVDLSERYGVVAAYEGVGEDGVPHTPDDIGLEAFPYEIVVRVSVRAERLEPARFGFAPTARPTAPISPREPAKARSKR